jgi:alkanesulfonate monooxygenase SsuD/methylene tetrahydromethanopterin reductase-like flavin-dependent oxidoreductase (luciferase family)
VWREKAFVGTPEQVSEKISRFLEAGCTGFIPWCPDYPSTETIELFATKVMPNFR